LISQSYIFIIFNQLSIILLILFFLGYIFQSQLSSVDQMRGMNMSNIAAMEQTRMLANTLAQNADPKFQVFIRCS
jgi:hypothetical protein